MYSLFTLNSPFISGAPLKVLLGRLMIIMHVWHLSILWFFYYPQVLLISTFLTMLLLVLWSLLLFKKLHLFRPKCFEAPSRGSTHELQEKETGWRRWINASIRTKTKNKRIVLNGNYIVLLRFLKLLVILKSRENVIVPLHTDE